jgi:hypothetical protein
MVGIAGSEGGGARLADTGAISPVETPICAVVPAASSGIGGNVGSGARVGAGIKVGHGVAVGLSIGAGDGDGGTVSANALAASRRATRSQAMTKPIRLTATKVALNPWPILLPLLRG